MYIANKIAKGQYVQQSNVATTTILTMTPDHMYTTHRTTTISWYYGSSSNNNKLDNNNFNFDYRSQCLSEVDLQLLANKQKKIFVSISGPRPQAVDNTRRVALVVRPACLVTEV
jgi:hypothetical protein